MKAIFKKLNFQVSETQFNVDEEDEEAKQRRMKTCWTSRLVKESCRVKRQKGLRRKGREPVGLPPVIIPTKSSSQQRRRRRNIILHLCGSNSALLPSLGRSARFPESGPPTPPKQAATISSLLL